MGSEKRVVVCNVFSDDNKGGCAITQQTIAWLKRLFPASPIAIVPVEQTGTWGRHSHRFTLARYPEVRVLRSPIRTDGSFFTTCAMLLRSLRLLWRGGSGDTEFERSIADAELVVSKGGYVFVERDTIGGLLALWFTAFPLIYASHRGVPTVALCTTVGPYRRFLSRVFCRWILRRIEVVVTRDPISTKEARRLGCQVVRECPDIAWTFENGRVGSEVLPARLPSVGRYGVVIVSGETPKLDDVFLARLGELSRRVLDEGLVDTLVVALQSLEDRAVTSRFVRSRDPRYILLDDDFSPEELMALYRDARFLMGRRLHAGVFALLGGTPTILFSTDGVKTDGVMSELGLSDRVFPYPDFPVEDAHRLLVTMLEHHEGEKKAILEKVSAARRRAERELGAIAALLRVEAPAPAIGLEATT